MELLALSKQCFHKEKVKYLHAANCRPGLEKTWNVTGLCCHTCQALDLLVKRYGPFAAINTSQNLGRMPCIYGDAPLMTLTWVSQGGSQE